MNRHVLSPRKRWFDETSISLEAFIADMKSAQAQMSCPLADDVQKNVPIYNASKIHSLINDQSSLDRYMNEWTDVLLDGPGIVVFRGAFADTSVVDRTTDVLNELIAEEKRRMGERGDHFGRVGQNARLWNAHEKLCIAAPEVFVRYNAIDIVDLISRAWLGRSRGGCARAMLKAVAVGEKQYVLGFKGVRDVAEGIALGVEYYSGIGKLNHPLPHSLQEHTVYVVMDFDRKPFDFNVGVGRGLTGATDQWTGKAIFNVPF